MNQGSGPEQPREAIASVARLAGQALADMAKERHGPLAEVSHVAALAAARLEDAAGDQDGEQVKIKQVDIDAILVMLRTIQNAGHLAFLKRHGSEADYQVVGSKLVKQYRTPSGKWKSSRK